MTSVLSNVLTRLQAAADGVEEAMRPYKPKNASQLRLKTDPAHRMMREAYKRRTSSDKTKDKRHDQLYYKRNKAQLQQRQRRSRQLHKHTSAVPDNQPFGLWCYEYVWVDGLHYSITIEGTRFEADCHAQRLNLQYLGELVDVYPVTETNLEEIQNNLPLATTHESNTSKDSKCIANVYAGRASTVTSGHAKREGS
jgi:hypothetical protein